jgi:hypothetical protein
MPAGKSPVAGQAADEDDAVRHQPRHGDRVLAATGEPSAATPSAYSATTASRPEAQAECASRCTSCAKWVRHLSPKRTGPFRGVEYDFRGTALKRALAAPAAAERTRAGL